MELGLCWLFPLFESLVGHLGIRIFRRSNDSAPSVGEMSIYTPIFPPVPISVPFSSSPSSSNATPSSTPSSWITLLSQRHIALAATPLELCPPSSPKLDENHVGEIRQKICDAVKAAKGDASMGKWAHVSRLTKLGCTRGRWQGAGMRHLEPKPMGDREWFLAETDEEWVAWEKNREETAMRGEKTKQGEMEETVHEQVVRPPSPLVTLGEEIVTKEKNNAGGAPASQASDVGHMKGVKGKGNSDVSERSTPLGFPVVKRAATLSNKGSGKQTTSRYFNNSRNVNIPGPSEAQVDPAPKISQLPSPAPKDTPSLPVNDIGPTPIPGPGSGPRPVVRAQRIDDVSEVCQITSCGSISDITMKIFFPPSFPSHLPTSTPLAPIPCAQPKTKPPPIPIVEPLFLSSPLSQPDYATIAISSSPSSPVSRKRPHSSSPTPVSARALHSIKKQRSASKTPPTSPPPPIAPEESGNGLGNAKGLPLPTTPDKQALPTLSQLLASSRRSRPRPRPPSRKGSSVYGHDETDDSKRKGKSKDLDRPLTPPPGTRTYFSSPASGSSSEGSPQLRPTSSPSPLFPDYTVHPSGFAPDLISTQPGAAGTLERKNSSGYLGMGYNSQFDVEGNIDRVSELLERDVDFGAWLRDIPPLDEQDNIACPDNADVEQ